MRITSPKRRSGKRINGRTLWERVRRWIIPVLLCLSLFFYREQLGEIIMGIRQVSMLRLCVGILLSLGAYALEGMAIGFMMDTSIPHDTSLNKCRERGRSGIRIAFLCEFYRMITFGSGSGIAEIHYMHENGIEPGNATALTMLQYMLKRAAVLVLGVLGYVVLYHGEVTGRFFREYGVFMGLAVLISLAVIACFLCLALSARIAACVLRFLNWLSVKWPSWEKRISGWKEQILLLNRSRKKVLGQGGKMLGAALCQFGKLLLFTVFPCVF